MEAQNSHLGVLIGGTVVFLPMDFQGGTSTSERELTSQVKLAQAGCYFDRQVRLNSSWLHMKSHITIKGTWDPRKKSVLLIAVICNWKTKRI